MQFNRSEDGTMTPLPKPSIDTGMGLERIAAVMQGKFNNYDSDLFTPIIDKIADTAGVDYGRDKATDTALRVIADHCRATTFLVADGVLPSNEGRGYVLRRIMRRAIRYGRTLGLKKPFLSGIIASVIEQMVDAYPHLTDAKELLNKVVQNEEERFLETLDHGLAMLSQEIKRLKEAGATEVAGDFTFKLYDTYGFPVDIVKDIAIEKGMVADEAGFNAAMEIQRAQSKKSWKGSSLAEMGAGVKDLRDKGLKATFVGYDTRHNQADIAAIINAAGDSVEQAAAGEIVSVFCLETPFYAESGGQAGDKGMIIAPSGKARVENTITAGDGLILHQAEVKEGCIGVGENAEFKVAENRRQRTANNHTATHLLQAALREVLGEHVKQSGSLVKSDRLRFDFTHFSPVTSDEMAKVEKMVNDEIRANIKVNTDLLDREEAIKEGATALFGEKYDEQVRVVSVGDFSKELCGGTHVGATGEIGLLKIISEGGIAAGVRRIEAMTGPEALNRFQQAEEQLAALAELVKSTPEELGGKLEKVLARQKELEKEVGKLTAQLSVNDLDSMLAEAREVAGVKLLVSKISIDSPKTMREVGDKVRDKLGSGIAVLGGAFEGKVSLLAIVSKDLSKQFHAGKIIKEVAAKVGGNGGGRPDMAQAGGTMVDKLPEALAAVADIVVGQAG
jgi:alanyl-tRNA synthetase